MDRSICSFWFALFARLLKYVQHTLMNEVQTPALRMAGYRLGAKMQLADRNIGKSFPDPSEFAPAIRRHFGRGAGEAVNAKAGSVIIARLIERRLEEVSLVAASHHELTWDIP